MDARLPSQVYLVGYSLLWLVVGLALCMMPRALALSPGEFGAVSMEQQFERAAGLNPLGASGLPELRLWSAASAAAPQEVMGVVVTPSGFTRLALARSQGWGRRYDVARRFEDRPQAAGQVLRLLPELARSDARYLVCGLASASLSVSGYVDGGAFHIRETGDCSGKRGGGIDRVLGLAAADAGR